MITKEVLQRALGVMHESDLVEWIRCIEKELISTPQLEKLTELLQKELRWRDSQWK